MPIGVEQPQREASRSEFLLEGIPIAWSLTDRDSCAAARLNVSDVYGHCL